MAILRSQLHVNRPLTNYVIGWKPPADGQLDWRWFSRGDFFPAIPTDKDSDFIRTVSMGRMLQIQNAIASSGIDSSSNVVDWAVGPTKAFKCLPYSNDAILNYYEAQGADAELQLETRTVRAPVWNLNQWCESVATPILLNSGNYGNNVTTLAANEYFDQYASSASTIYDTMAYGFEQIALNTGHKVNRIGMTAPVWRIIKGHPGLTRRPFNNQGGNSPSVLTTEMFEGLFSEWVEKGALRIYGGYYNRSGEPVDDGSDNETIDGCLYWGPSIVACYVEQTPSLDDFSFAKSFYFGGMGDGEALPFVVYEFEDLKIQPRGGRIYRVVTSADYKIMNKRAGWIWPTVIDKTSSLFTNGAGNSWYA